MNRSSFTASVSGCVALGGLLLLLVKSADADFNKVCQHPYADYNPTSTPDFADCDCEADNHCYPNEECSGEDEEYVVPYQCVREPETQCLPGGPTAVDVAQIILSCDDFGCSFGLSDCECEWQINTLGTVRRVIVDDCF